MTKDNTLLDSESTAALLGISPRTLEGWRRRGRGPRFLRLSHRVVRYRRSDLAKWLRRVN